MSHTRNRCPSCQTNALAPTQLARQQVLECRECGGLWFEDNGLNRAIANRHEHIDQYDHEQHLGEKIGPGERVCRRCDQAMERYHLLENYEVEIDCCPSCDGVWLDRDEVQSAMQSPRLRRALQTLNQSTGWRSWAFQFLTQMPVEYNLKPQRTPWVCWIIIALCTALFAAGQLFPSLEVTLLNTLGFSTNSGWLMTSQLITHQFMHGSWLHLLGNMYFLWLVGDNIEDALGHWRFLALYLVAGVVAALAQWAFYQANGPLLLVGASGAIAALFGIYLMWFRYASLTMMIFVVQIKLAPHWYFLFWSATNIVGMMVGDTQVAYWAHLGGFAFGLLAGYAARPWLYRQKPIVKLLNQPETKLERNRALSARFGRARQ